MQLEEIKWLDSCKNCGVVVNAKTVYDGNHEESSPMGYYENSEFLPWKCPKCDEYRGISYQHGLNSPAN